MENYNDILNKTKKNWNISHASLKKEILLEQMNCSLQINLIHFLQMLDQHSQIKSGHQKLKVLNIFWQKHTTDLIFKI